MKKVCPKWQNTKKIGKTKDHKTNLHTAYLKFSPPSATSYCRPDVRPDTNSFRCACSKADHIFASSYLWKGSKFIRSLPLNNTGSC